MIAMRFGLNFMNFSLQTCTKFHFKSINKFLFNTSLNKFIGLLVFVGLMDFDGWGQISMSTTGSHTQNFNSLISTSSVASWTDNSTINGWYWQRTGSGTTYAASTGSVNFGNAYIFWTTKSGNFIVVNMDKTTNC